MGLGLKSEKRWSSESTVGLREDIHPFKGRERGRSCCEAAGMMGLSSSKCDWEESSLFLFHFFCSRKKWLVEVTESWRRTERRGKLERFAGSGERFATKGRLGGNMGRGESDFSTELNVEVQTRCLWHHFSRQ